MVDGTEIAAGRRRAPEQWEASARARVAAQIQLVASVKPGSAMHKIATETLLLFQDSLHLVIEARQTLNAVGAMDGTGPGKDGRA